MKVVFRIVRLAAYDRIRTLQGTKFKHHQMQPLDVIDYVENFENGRGSSVAEVSGCLKTEARYSAESGISLFVTPCRPVLGLTQPHLHCVPCNLFDVVKGAEA